MPAGRKGFEKSFVTQQIWYNEYISIASKYADLASGDGQAQAFRYSRREC